MIDIEEISSEDMIVELDLRGDTPVEIEIEYETEYIETIVEVEKPIHDLYRHLCDICEVGYYTSKEDILIKLKEKI